MIPDATTRWRLWPFTPARIISRRDTAGRLRAGIMLVATAAVLLTAGPLLVYSMLTGATIEGQRIDLIGEIVAQNVTNEAQNLRSDVAAMAASPIVATALTDSAGREGYLRPFLQQRATALGATMILLDYRGRELLRELPNPGGMEAPAGQPTKGNLTIAASPVTALEGNELIHRVPIFLFVNQRAIGALEARIPVTTLLRKASRGFGDDVAFTLLRDNAVVTGGEQSTGPAGPRHNIVAAPAEGGRPALEFGLIYQAKAGQMAHYFASSATLVLATALLSLGLAALAAQRMARKLTEPLKLLVAASERFRAGEIPDLKDVQSVTEIAQLGQALTDAFIARDEAQHEIRRYTERMLEGLPVAVFSGKVQADGNFFLDYLSPGVARMTGWTPEELRDFGSFAEKAAPHAGRLLRDAMQQTFAAGSAILDFPLRRADGSASWQRLRARIIERPIGVTEILMAGTLTDVTEEQRLAEQAVNSAKLVTLGEMATGLAHELNQPLAVITLAAENSLRSLARSDPARLPDLSARQERIIQQAMRARAIVDHLRIFGRHDTGDLEAIQIQDVIDGAKILVGGLLRESGIQLEVDIPPHLPAVRARLVPAEHVIVNLLVNARDSIRDGGITSGKVTLSAEMSGDRLILHVRDNGPGFPSEFLPRVFEPFFTTKEVGKGTGLGLSICHGTMRSFGGAIAAANHPGGGAEFSLSFRIASEGEPPL